MAEPFVDAVVRVIIGHERFNTVMREVRLVAVRVKPDDQPWSAVGFRGTASDLAAFMLAAREAFGAYDSEMLARVVRSFAIGFTPGGAERFTFYFPGLELA